MAGRDAGRPGGEALRRPEGGEGWLRSFLRNTADVVTVLSADNTVLYDSPAIGRAFGYAPGERVGEKGLDYVHPGDREMVGEAFAELLRAPGVDAPLGYRMRRKDGSWRHVEAVRNNLLDDPAVGGVVVVYRDVTEREEAEERLRFQARLLNAVGQAVVAVDLGGRITYWNRAAEGLYGWSAEEVIGRLAREVMVPEDQQEPAAKIQAELAEGRRWSGEFVVRRRDGATFPVTVTDTPVFDGRGSLVGVIGVSADVTERKEAEEALRLGEETQRRRARELSLLHEIRSALAEELDPDGVCRAVVEAVAKAYGYALVSAYLVEGGAGGEAGGGGPDPELVMRHQVGYRTVLGRIPAGRGVMWRVVRTGEPVLLEDARADPDFLDAIQGVVSEACVPLFDGGEIAGTLNVESTGGMTLDAADLGLLEEVGEHAGVALGRARLHERLGEAEERYRNLVEQIPAVTYIDRADGSFESLYTSPQIEDMLGYTPEEWLTQKLWEKRLHPEDRERILAADDLLEVDGQPFSEEYRLLAKDGRLVWVREEAVLVRSEAAEPLYWQGIITDITDRKETEEALKRNEERFRSLVQNASEVILVMGGDGAVRYVSPALERVLGYRPEDVVGNDSFEVLHPDDTAAVREVIADAVKRPGTPFHAELRLRHADGSWRHMESKCTSLLGDPTVGGVVFNSRDVTEPKRAEEALKESERRFRSSFEDAAVGMALVGTDGRWLRVNRSLCEIVGYSEEELLGMIFQDITHPEDLGMDLQQSRRLLQGEVRSYQVEKRYLHREGHVVWILLNGSLVQDGEGRPLYFIAQVQDISDRKRMEGQLQRQALHDPLTGLPNRKLFVDRLGHALERTRRKKDRRVAVLFMDLDDFKVINDSLGHEAGDLLLTVVAERLGRCLRPEDTLARFGGDEFVVLMEDVGGDDEAVRVAGRITEELRQPFLLNGHELFTSASIGIGLGDVWSKTPEYLLRDSDTAMYRAKDEGSGYRVFDAAMYEGAMRRLELEGALRRAIERDEFVLHYQPMASVSTGEIVGTEALVRWQHPEHGLMAPSGFIPVAEETGLIVPMGRLVLMEACRQAKEWQRRYPKALPLAVGVNLSARQLRNPGLVGEVVDALEHADLDPGSLTLEITESTLVEDERSTGEVLRRLKKLGLRLAIDDFGVGYSSLSYLRYLPVDRLKLDRVLVGSLDTDSKNLAIVRAAVDLGHALGMEVVAEGVETHGEFEELRELGCDVGQGYYWWSPRPPGAAEELLTSTPDPLPDRRP